ncbi:MAG: T9SS type A sorting domain-containing protein [Bacteroidota bacterium]
MAQAIHPSPSCPNGYNSYELQWGTIDGFQQWPAGSLSNEYLNVDGSACRFTFELSGDVGDFSILGTSQTPYVQPFYADGLTNVLSLRVEPFNGTGSEIDLQIKLFPAIPARLAFDLYYVLKDNVGRADQIKVFASYGNSTPIYPQFNGNGSSSWTEVEDGTLLATGLSNNGQDDQVGVLFDSAEYIDRIQIQWRDCSGCPIGERGLGIGHIQFCTAGADWDQDGLSDTEDTDDDNDGIPDTYELCLDTPPPPLPTETTIAVEIQFDEFPDYISWDLRDSSGNIVRSSPAYDRMTYATAFVRDEIVLPAGSYQFNIRDAFLNGICCGNYDGYYQVRSNGFIVLGGTGNGNFGASASGTFRSDNLPVSAFNCLEEDPAGDKDQDGIPNFQDADFCTLNHKGVCASLDQDSDGLINSFDLDSDNDGILDSVESDGKDGITNQLPNSDKDQQPDLYDVDADNDGIYDNYEAQATQSYIAPGNSDLDGDGLLDAYDTQKGFGGSGLQPNDQDADGQADFRDLDSDNDYLPDWQEAWDQLADGDSRPDNLNFDQKQDADRDGLLQCFDLDDEDASIIDWVGQPANDNGQTDSGQMQSQGTPFITGITLDDLLPDNGQQAEEPDFRDPISNFSNSRVGYAFADGSATFSYDPSSGIHNQSSNSGKIRATAAYSPNGDDWHYYYNPLQPGLYLFAIRNGTGSSNLVPMSELIDYIEIQEESNPAARYKEGGSKAFLVMQRDWNVVLKQEPAAGSTFDIRFYFQPEELKTLDTAAAAILSTQSGGQRQTLKWFKKSGGLNNADISSNGIEGFKDISSTANILVDEKNGIANTDGNNLEAGNGKNFIQFEGLSSFSGGTAMVEIDLSPLPVTLDDFGGQAEGCEVNLHWLSAEELNFSHYELEQSNDGKTFRSIANLAGSQNTGGASYHFRDRNAGHVNYYRLKMIDLDLQYAYSPVVVVKTDCLLPKADIQLYPNPIAQNAANVHLRLYNTENKVVLRLRRSNGQVLHTEEFPAPKGWITHSIDLSDLPAGIYFLSNDYSEYSQVVKLIVTDL